MYTDRMLTDGQFKLDDSLKGRNLCLILYIYTGFIIYPTQNDDEINEKKEIDYIWLKRIQDFHLKVN